MSAAITEVLGGLDAWSVDLTWDPDLAEQLVEGAVLQVRRGRRLVYAGVILTPKILKEGISISGQSLEWWLGGDEGPLIESREYVAGTNKLPNGDFELGGLYWTTRQDTKWVLRSVDGEPHAGLWAAVVTGDGDKDDVLEVDRAYDVAAGQTYELFIWAHRPSGTVGRLRLRALFEGRFDTPNLLTNGDFELGPGIGWGSAIDLAIVTDAANAHAGSKVLRASTSTRPDLMVDGDLEAGGMGWGTATDLAIVSDAPNARSGSHVLKARPSTRPQRLTNGDFETLDLTGWTLAGNSYLTPVSNVINDPIRARNGDGVLLMGTVPRRAVDNGGFETGDLSSWTDLPGTGEWSVNNVDRSGNYAAQLDGSLVGLDAALVAQVPSEQPTVGAGTPHHHIATSPGEHWQFLGYAMKDPGSPPSGAFEAWAELQFYPADTTATDFTVIQSHHVTDLDPVGSWRTLLIDVKTPAGDFTNMVVTLQIHTPTSGLCHFDDIECIRVEGNEETLTADAVTVAAGETWELEVNARSAPAFISGGLFPRVTLSGSGQPDVVLEDPPISQTNGAWISSRRRVSIPDGYDTAVVALRARDIVGDWIEVDDVTFTRVGGNLDTITAAPIDVIPGLVEKSPVKAATATNHALSGLAVIDGYETVDGDRVLLTGQTTPTQNGIWAVHAGAWTRPADFAVGSDAAGAWVYVSDGTPSPAGNKATNFGLSGASPVVVDTDVQTWSSVFGAEYELAFWARSGPLFTDDGGALLPRLTITGAGVPDLILDLAPIGQTDNTWTLNTQSLKIAPGYDTVQLSFTSSDIVGDSIWVDDLSFIRTKGNVDRILADPLTLVPERSYKLEATARSADLHTEGEIKLSVLLSAPGRPDKILETSPLAATEHDWKQLSLDVTPPSGYDTAVVSVVATDVVNEFYVDDMSLVDQDGTTLAIDWPLPSMPSGWTQFILGTDVFTGTGGTETLRFQIVAEADSAGWVVDDASLRRVDVAPVTVAEIVADLLLHPKTGLPILTVGTIDGADTILWDWQITNALARTTLQALLTAGVCSPTREYRIDPDGTLSVGLAEDLYDDRVDLVFADVPDLVTVNPPDVTPDRSRRFTEVKLIGAQVPAAGGDTVTITATAQVPGDVPVDYQGNPLVRTKLVSDPTVDHPAFAAAYAVFLAEQEAGAVPAITIDISDTSAIGEPFRAGDWVYAYKPDAGIEDETNEMALSDGRRGFPQKQRVVQLEHRLGPGYSLEVRHPDGSVYEIDDDLVLWEKATSATLTLGALRRDFVVNSQGTAAFKQFLRFLASRAK